MPAMLLLLVFQCAAMAMAAAILVLKFWTYSGIILLVFFVFTVCMQLWLLLQGMHTLFESVQGSCTR